MFVEILTSISDWLLQSSIREFVIWTLRNVPGLPPIVQTLHICAIVALVGSAAMIALRQLGLAVPSQDPTEMYTRLMPWVWWALLGLFCTGVVFVIARPVRYLFNPIAGWKLLCLLSFLSVLLTLCWCNYRQQGYWLLTLTRQRVSQGLSILLLVSLVGIIMAGRWIAYVDYIYWE